MTDTGIIILAAGSASRFGGIKQLLPFNNTTLIQHTIDQAKAAGAAPVIVVTGANADIISAAIDHHAVDIIFNENWQQGKSSGVVAGIRHVLHTYPSLQHIIIAVCDHPYVTAALFAQLAQQQQETQKNMVASAYDDTIGTPVLFSRKYFEQLLQLKKEEGAKKLLMTHRDDVATVDFPEGGFDIDTREEYERFLKRRGDNPA